MSLKSIAPQLVHRYVIELERAWPGLTVERLEVAVRDDQFVVTSEAVREFVSATIRGPEEALVAAGLISQDDVDSIPPCGICYRSGWNVRRRKGFTRLDGHMPLDVLARIIVPALVWRPPQAA